MKKPYIVGFIFARGGSKGLPRKNIYPLAGKPLIAYAIETAKASDLIDRVVVSTDDTEIAEVARAYGAEAPFIRPAELARDDSPEWLAWQHAIQTVKQEHEIDVFVSIPATSPLRTVEDVNNCINTFLMGETDLVITVTPAARNPYYNMVVLDNGANARLVITDIPIHRRQDAPSVYDMTTVAYVASPKYILRASYLFSGRIKAVVIPRERALDIDDPLDLEFAEFLLQRSGGHL